MDIIENIFHNRKIIFSKLITYGFLKEEHNYVLKKNYQKVN